jgi:hypothetical protein
MSRQEHEREDLLREATALLQRAELRVEPFPEPVVAGFRHGGAFSVYFGGDPVYQFNTAGQLRRAFVDGLLYKAEQGWLVALRREHNDQETLLVRHLLDAREQSALLQDAQQALTTLATALQQHRFTLLGQIPEDGDIVTSIQFALAALPEPLEVAQRPHAN